MRPNNETLFLKDLSILQKWKKRKMHTFLSFSSDALRMFSLGRGIGVDKFSIHQKLIMGSQTIFLKKTNSHSNLLDQKYSAFSLFP